MNAGPGLLTADTVVPYLRARGVLGPCQAGARELSGGVSSKVLLVHGPERAIVVKQALPQLRVAADWRADPRRTLIEARALAEYGHITPEAVPALLDLDEDRGVLVMTAVPEGFAVWKAKLLAGVVDARVGATLGDVLGRWHAATLDDEGCRMAFADTAPFRQLRLDPFYGVVARAHPALGPQLEEAARDLLRSPRCLVHGDLSPKNVLVCGPRAVVLDCEVAHFGDPVFDLAFLLHHLVLKAVARPGDAPAIENTCGRFLATYRERVGPALVPDDGRIIIHVASLALARVDGKSPVDYLDARARDDVRDIARSALGTGGMSYAELWKRIRER